MGRHRAWDVASGELQATLRVRRGPGGGAGLVRWGWGTASTLQGVLSADTCTGAGIQSGRSTCCGWTRSPGGSAQCGQLLNGEWFGTWPPLGGSASWARCQDGAVGANLRHGGRARRSRRAQRAVPPCRSVQRPWAPAHKHPPLPHPAATHPKHLPPTHQCLKAIPPALCTTVCPCCRGPPPHMRCRAAGPYQQCQQRGIQPSQPGPRMAEAHASRSISSSAELSASWPWRADRSDPASALPSRGDGWSQTERGS